MITDLIMCSGINVITGGYGYSCKCYDESNRLTGDVDQRDMNACRAWCCSIYNNGGLWTFDDVASGVCDNERKMLGPGIGKRAVYGRMIL